MYEPHTGFRQPIRGVAGAAAVLAFAVVFLVLAGTYLADTQEAREDACATQQERACDDAERDRNVATLSTVGVALVAAGGAFVVTRSVTTRRAADAR